MSEGLSLEYLEKLTLFDQSFEYDGISYKYEDIAHIYFTATATSHSLNGIPTGTSHEAHLVLELKSGKNVAIEQKAQFIGRAKKEYCEAVMRANGILSDITFTSRMMGYEEQLKKKGFVTWGRYQIAANGDLFKDNELRMNLRDKDVKISKSSPFQINCSKPQTSFWAKMFASDDAIVISTDRDCFMYFMKHTLGFSWSDEHIRTKRGTNREIFHKSLIILGAKLCKADGHVSVDEIKAFKRYFEIDEENYPGSAKVFMDAVNSNQSITEAAKDIFEIFGEEKDALEYILIGLMQIAAADGKIDDAERKLIQAVAKVFEFNNQEIQRIFAMFESAKSERPRGSSSSQAYANEFKILGIKESSTWEEIRFAYVELARRHHPDRLRGQGIPLNDIKNSEELLKAINVAYATLERRFNVRAAA